MKTVWLEFGNTIIILSLYTAPNHSWDMWFTFSRLDWVLLGTRCKGIFWL